MIRANGTGVAEYTYESDTRHLNDSEALESYKKAKAQHGGAIIELEDLPCGHWNIRIHETEGQKQTFYRRRLLEVYKRVLDAINK